MEPNEDIAAPDTEDMDTVEMPVAAQNPALTQPNAPAEMDTADDAEAIEDTETTTLDSVGASDISREDTIQFAASKPLAEQHVDDGDDGFVGVSVALQRVGELLRTSDLARPPERWNWSASLRAKR